MIYRAVYDTNVIVSALLKPRNEHDQAESVRLDVTQEILLNYKGYARAWPKRIPDYACR